MEHGFLQLTALSPCFSMLVEGLEVEAGVWDLCEGGVLRGQAREETVFTCNDSSSISERRFSEEEEI